MNTHVLCSLLGSVIIIGSLSDSRVLFSDCLETREWGRDSVRHHEQDGQDPRHAHIRDRVRAAAGGGGGGGAARGVRGDQQPRPRPPPGRHLRGGAAAAQGAAQVSRAWHSS